MIKFDSKFFIDNRQRLCDSLPNSLIILTANDLLQRSSDTTFPFRQDSNFWYLTGIEQPDFMLVIDTTQSKSTILLPKQNEYQKVWDGEIDTELLKNSSGVESYVKNAELESIIEKAVSEKKVICYIKPPEEVIEPYGFFANPARRNLSLRINRLVEDPKDIRLEIARLRQIKQPDEISAIKSAIEITGKSLVKIRRDLSSFKTEADVLNRLSAEFYGNGASDHAFEPIVASGMNATTIHYRKNNDLIDEESLILLDVGAQSGLYAADISRTWSISKPTNRQSEIHNLVLDIQKFALSLIKPGILLRDYQTKVEKYAKEVMNQAKCSTANDPYPHGISHFLGLDVHDAGDYDLPLQENMIITVEPGIYLKDEGIGVRIEDDILVTKTGFINLSEEISQSL